MADDEFKYVVRMLQDTNLKAIARNVGLSYMTVYRIANGINLSPSFQTVSRLAKYFHDKELAA